jgi:hypothetical protein
VSTGRSGIAPRGDTDIESHARTVNSGVPQTDQAQIQSEYPVITTLQEYWGAQFCLRRNSETSEKARAWIRAGNLNKRCRD